MTAPMAVGDALFVRRAALLLHPMQLLASNSAARGARRTFTSSFSRPCPTRYCMPSMDNASSRAPSPSMTQGRRMLTTVGRTVLNNKHSRGTVRENHMRSCFLLHRGLPLTVPRLFHSSNAHADPYKVLGLPKTASVTDIKKRYRELAKQHHPDLNPGPDSAGKMAEISSAYQLLSDPKRREIYDRSGIYPDDSSFAQESGFPGGTAGFSGDPSFMFTDFTSFFADAFGGGGYSRAGGHVHRGEDVATEVSLDFLEAASGCRKVVHLHTNASCSDCNGTGCSPGTSLSTCRTCNGTGTQKIERGPIIFGTVCSRCNGSGQVVVHPCKGCKGAGVKTQPRAVDLDFPAGVRNGMELRVSNQGHAGARGGKAGDLFVKVNVKPHAQFKLIHDDLHVTVPLSFKQCLTGGEVIVPTLEGKLKLVVPPGTVPGETKTLRGKGIKKLQERGYGDLAIHWSLQVPSQLTERQKQLVTEFDQIEQEKAMGSSASSVFSTAAHAHSTRDGGSSTKTGSSPSPPPKPSHVIREPTSQTKSTSSSASDSSGSKRIKPVGDYANTSTDPKPPSDTSIGLDAKNGQRPFKCTTTSGNQSGSARMHHTETGSSHSEKQSSSG